MGGDDDFRLGKGEGDASSHRVTDDNGIFRNNERIIEREAREIRQIADHFCPVFLIT